MAIYSLNHSWVGRSTHKPRTAGAAVRYITRPEAATKIMGERMPTEPRAARAWIDRQELADRKNARVIDKVIVALPVELTHEQRAQLVHDYAENMSRGRASWLAAIHDGPGEVNEKGQHNPHAHIIFRDRDLATGKRVMELSEMGGTLRLRVEWERDANAALERAGLDVRIDRRTLKEQGIDREAQIHVGPNALAMVEEHGERPASKPLEMIRHVHGEHTAIVIDYPAIDAGRTRAEANEEIQQRNKAREREAGDDWTDRAGMVAQQQSAMQMMARHHRPNDPLPFPLQDDAAMLPNQFRRAHVPNNDNPPDLPPAPAPEGLTPITEVAMNRRGNGGEFFLTVETGSMEGGHIESWPTPKIRGRPIGDPELDDRNDPIEVPRAANGNDVAAPPVAVVAESERDPGRREDPPAPDPTQKDMRDRLAERGKSEDHIEKAIARFIQARATGIHGASAEKEEDGGLGLDL